MLAVSSKAPDFTLMETLGTSFKLSDQQGQKVVLFFYPKDMTPGCTQEACDFQASLSSLGNVVLAGISQDSLESHQKFKDKHGLEFSLLSDPTGEVCQAYGVLKERKMYGKSWLGIERTTFLLDEQSVILKIWRRVKVEGHVQEVLGTLR